MAPVVITSDCFFRLRDELYGLYFIRRRGFLIFTLGYSVSCLNLALSFGSLNELAGAVQDSRDLLVREAEGIFQFSASNYAMLCDICSHLVGQLRISQLSLSRLARALSSRAHRLQRTFYQEIEVSFRERIESHCIDTVSKSHLVKHNLITFPFLYTYILTFFLRLFNI